MRLVAIRNIFHHKLRLLLTTVAVIAGVAFISGTYIFTDTLSESFNQVFTSLNAKVDVVVRAKGVISSARTRPGSNRGVLGDSVLQQVRNTPGVSSATGLVLGYALLLDK